jgi:hypothetical protein
LFFLLLYFQIKKKGILMRRNRIILDAMAGDNAPHEIIKGAVLACNLISPD